MAKNLLARGAALTALAFAAQHGAAFAQETTSAVRGEVTDFAGAPLPGAEVVVTHVPSGTRSVETTGPSGIFDLRGLRVGGPYTIEVTAPDYQGERVEDVFLTVGQPFRIVVDLDPSEEAIVIVAERTGVTDAVGSNTVLGRDQIESTVSVTRDIRDLARRDPLVSQNARGDGGISIAGSNPRTNRITIDGVQAQDDFGLNTGGLPTRRGPVSLDAVSQFSVETAPFDVENGDFLGGQISVVLREGTNDFEGSLFLNYLNEGLVGTRVGGTPVSNFTTQDNWGATFRGPIFEDTLFFALSYETYTSADTTSTGPAGGGFASAITGPTGGPMTQAEIDAVTNVFANIYGSTFPFGAITATKPITDEKYTARLDWNITDDHRASLTWRSSESGVIQRTNLNSTTAGLDSQWYLTGEDDETYSLQINSDWTNELSTELRVSTRDYVRLQEPPAGQDFSDIRVCSTATVLDTGGSSPQINCRLANNSTTVGSVRFGPDQFRHANYLETSNDQVQFSAEYQLADHLLKAGVQWQQTDIFNIFLPNSDGTFYFDSVADFAAGRASQLIYRNAISGDENDAAAIFGYAVTTGFVQDSWDLTPDFTLNYGLRWDYYSTDDKPAENPNFAARYGGRSNQETYDGRDILMPRVSFTYDWTDDLRLSGGVGLFSGGLPDVFLSNVFSNTGIIDNTLTFERTANSTSATSYNSGAGWLTETSGAVNCAATPTICTDALNVAVNSSFGTSIPASVQAALGGTSASPTSEVNVISPDFEIPSDWKANISVGWDFIEGWRLGFDAVGLRTETGLAFRDIRARPLIVNGAQALTPDGRIRYDGLSTAQRNSIVGTTVSSTNPGSNRDIEAYNPGEHPFSWIASISLQGEFLPGLSGGFSYTVQDMEEYSASARFSSTASSLYGGQFTSYDPNAATTGRSQEEIEESFKFNLDWTQEFVPDLETRFSLFGEVRSGRPSTFTMNAGSSRNATFGVNRGAQLAYVPDLSNTATVPCGASTVCITSDPLVSFDSAATLNNLIAMVDRFDIPTGGIVPRSSYNNDNIEQVDLQISQEIPALFEGNRAMITFDIANVLNLINDEWGVVQEFPEDFRLFDVSCAGADGVNDNDGVLTCQRYRISGVNTSQLQTRNTDRSRWVIQIGLRYEF